MTVYFTALSLTTGWNQLGSIYVVKLQDFTTKFTVHRYSLESFNTQAAISASVVAVLHSAVIDSWTIVFGHVKIAL